eukprot:gene17485-24204_t
MNNFAIDSGSVGFQNAVVQDPNESLWSSSLSLSTNLDEAVLEAINLANPSLSTKANVAIFFVSSIYEGTFPYDLIHQIIHEKLPNVKYIIGSTAGTVIGKNDIDGEPMEIEARSSFSLLLANTEDDVSASLFHIENSKISSYLKNENVQVFDEADSTPNKNKEEGIAILFAAETSKRDLSSFLLALNERENLDGFGGISSSVTTLQVPKVFISKYDKNGLFQFEKFTSGVVGLSLRGNIAVQRIIARSCLPVGPLYEITDNTKDEIISMRLFEDSNNNIISDMSKEALPPLVQLNNILDKLSPEDSFTLKKELLIGISSTSPETLALKGSPSIINCEDFFAQEPSSFDPITGSIYVPCIPQSA